MCLIAGFLATISLVACGAGNGEEPESGKPVRVVFNVDRSAYEGGTRADEASWKEGDRIFLRFNAGGSVITHGLAVYKEGNWVVSYYGPVTTGTNQGLTCTYIESPADASKPLITFNENTVPYVDASGTYNYDGTTLSITATLKPKVGRLRFKGDPNTTITVTGLTTYTTYQHEVNTYTTVSEPVTLKVGEDGYTRYVYGQFNQASSPFISIETETAWFMKDLPTSVYTPGDSGYIIIPTETDRNGWFYNEIHNVTVDGLKIPMMKVVSSTGDVYYVSQTEVTQKQYNTIMGGTASQPQHPIAVTYNNAVSYMDKLSQLTGKKFSMITMAEWQWACKGGIYSRNYTYPGSNKVDEVAWHSGNSGSAHKQVKLLKPNEIGLYDMAGNMAELTNMNDNYYFSVFGGGVLSSSSYCQVSSSSSEDRSISGYGNNTSYAHAIRLCMKE